MTEIIYHASCMLILMKGVTPTVFDSPLSARRISGKSSSAEEDDVDVARERERVYEGKAEKDLLRICDLTKVRYHTFLSYY